MKTRKPRTLLIALLFAVAFLLSACQVNFITDIKSDGAGVYSQEIGFKSDEASMAGLNAGDENFCTSQNNELPPGTTTRQETRNKDETWCIYETPFKSLDDLKAIYGTTDTLINDISLTDGKLTYDISLDLGSDSSNMPTGSDIFWIVTMPGRITENNATEKDGNTLKWKLLIGQANKIHVVSNTGGLSIGGDSNWYLIGGAALCLCCIVVLIIIGVVVFIVLRRKKNAANVETPAP
jgi:predicted small secreted protein